MGKGEGVLINLGQLTSVVMSRELILKLVAQLFEIVLMFSSLGFKQGGCIYFCCYQRIDILCFSFCWTVQKNCFASLIQKPLPLPQTRMQFLKQINYFCSGESFSIIPQTQLTSVMSCEFIFQLVAQLFEIVLMFSSLGFNQDGCIYFCCYYKIDILCFLFYWTVQKNCFASTVTVTATNMHVVFETN